MPTLTVNIPDVKPGGNPGFAIRDLRDAAAALEAASARIEAQLKALGAGRKPTKPAGGPVDGPSPWEAGAGFLPRIFDARPDVRALHDAFHAFPILDEWRPEYQAARRAYVKALYGTTVESRIRKMAGMFIRTVRT